MNTALKIIDAVIGLNTGILFSSLMFTGSRFDPTLVNKTEKSGPIVGLKRPNPVVRKYNAVIEAPKADVVD